MELIQTHLSFGMRFPSPCPLPVEAVSQWGEWRACHSESRLRRDEESNNFNTRKDEILRLKPQNEQLRHSLSKGEGEGGGGKYGEF